ncbi:hypothetical protein FSP39_016730 [Pinctada imbricata]|uniref:Uncharacterized protein n=1 Tax=Pinctada imbricata TaxID=66713 RepID=A0AA88XZI9_PINIB|nr:hypothetical protein FSP39_016730 [Pinctada imbricata]
MLAAQFIQNATKGTETLVNQPQTTMVHSNLLQSNTTQSQPDGYHSNSPANQQSLQSLISELTSQNGLTTPLTNAGSPQQQFPSTPSQPSAPQIIICNPPGNSGNSGQQAPPPTSVPSSTGMPSIVILPGGGNSTTQAPPLYQYPALQACQELSYSQVEQIPPPRVSNVNPSLIFLPCVVQAQGKACQVSLGSQEEEMPPLKSFVPLSPAHTKFDVICVKKTSRGREHYVDVTYNALFPPTPPSTVSSSLMRKFDFTCES